MAHWGPEGQGEVDDGDFTGVAEDVVVNVDGDVLN